MALAPLAIVHVITSITVNWAVALREEVLRGWSNMIVGGLL